MGVKKMKLINANEIRYSDLSGGQVPEGVWCTWKDRIDAMPAVDAIPVEWIKKYIKDHTFMMINPDYVDDTYNYIHFTEEPIDYKMIVTPTQIDSMLKAWRRENE